MEHVRQTELIQLAANELADPRRAEVEHHLAACPACRALYAQQQALWGALGDWRPDETPLDLRAGVERRLADSGANSRPLWLTLGRASRVAAAVVIGVGVGYGAARTWSPQQPTPVPVTPAASEQAAVEALGIDYLAPPSPAGLYAALPDASDDGESEEGQS
ncbi:MAG: anti-sigma factor [Phycisphaerae bacterium]|jgi:anti-sigma factor RsiW